MYCSTCGTPITQGLSFCNRCGANLKDRSGNQNLGPISAFLTAIVILGVVGLGIMLGGSLVLRKEANLPFELVGAFMFFTFFLVGIVEFMLIRQLSRLTGAIDDRRYFPPAQPLNELSPASVNNPGQSIGSVTENTTRTLEYARREQ
ncbi:MAG TPA: zinc ribbon domain-containing protein [Pyrinomonadaceae bacterium]|nr:zinc ribbon domain-containing protein [Pyrinomonadaceae bacterium]